MATPQSIYQALPLKENRREIRLLRFEKPQKDLSQITMSMIKVSLDNPGLLYNTLSYCWGEPVFDRAIVCNQLPIRITSGLFAALQRLQHMPGLSPGHESPEHNRWGQAIWVDQICINQQDLSERSSQVGMMKDIYNSGRICYCYLGEETTGTRLALLYAQFKIRQRTVKSSNQTFLMSPNDWKESDLYSGDLSDPSANYDEGAKALLAFINRPYFRRGWIIQEVAVSPMSIGLCGRHVFRFGGLWEALLGKLEGHRPVGGYTMLEFCDLAGLHSINRDNVSRIINLGTCRLGWQLSGTEHADIRAMAAHKGLSTELLWLLSRTRDFEVSDPKDKIYALHSLATDSYIYPRPDYSLDLGIIYQKYAECFVAAGKGLDCIQNVADRSRLAIPSWVPDWSANANVLFRLTSETWTGTQDAVRMGAIPGTIEVETRRVWVLDKVLHYRTRNGAGETEVDLVWVELNAMKAFVTETGVSFAEFGNVWNYLYTLICEGGRDWADIMGYSHTECRAAFFNMIKEAEQGSTDIFEVTYRGEDGFWRPRVSEHTARQQIARLLDHFMAHCRLALTSDGAVVLACKRASAGDELFHFRGALALSILRSKSGTNTFEFVGTAYHGNWAGSTCKDTSSDWETVVLA